MTPIPNPTAEQIVAQAIAIMNFGDALDMETFAEEAEVAVAALRAHGLLSEGALRGASFLIAATAERATHVSRGWTIEHDRAHGVDHLLRLALDYEANGKSVKAGALIIAARETLAWQAQQGALSEDQIEVEFERARDVIDRMFGWKHLRRYSRMSEEWMDGLRDGIARAITSGRSIPAASIAPQPAPQPLAVDEATLRKAIDNARHLWDLDGRREPISHAISRAIVEHLQGSHDAG